jgi:hypothetical protein
LLPSNEQSNEEYRSAFKFFSPSKALQELASGTKSSDGVTIVGKSSVLLLHQGTNRFYDQLTNQPQPALVDKWLDVFSKRFNTLGTQRYHQALILPEKTSAMIDLLPLPFIRFRPQVVLDLVAKSTQNIIFGEDLIAASKVERRFESSVWNHLESHLTEFGAIMVFNQFLTSNGLSPVAYQIVSSSILMQSGDLVWPDMRGVISETKNSEVDTQLKTPNLVSDNAPPSGNHRNRGRLVVWKNSNPINEAHILIIGNSFSGGGYQKINITYWASRYFAKTTFLHSNAYPIDTKSAINPDILLFQSNDRFLVEIPDDTKTFAELTY